MIVSENELRGLELYIERFVRTRECSRQTPCLDISQMGESESYFLFINRSITKPSQFVGLWLICLAKNPEWKDIFRLELEERCKKNQYKNEWMILHKVLKLNSLQLALYILLENYFSSRDLRGNILPIAEKLWMGVNFLKIKRKRPRRPQFHRGYRDHGGRRLPHEVHDMSQWSGSNPEKLDLTEQLKKKNFVLNFLYS